MLAGPGNKENIDPNQANDMTSTMSYAELQAQVTNMMGRR